MVTCLPRKKKTDFQIRKRSILWLEHRKEELEQTAGNLVKWVTLKDIFRYASACSNYSAQSRLNIFYARV